MGTRQPLNPQTKVGKVVFNGEIHGPLCTQARDSQRPYYARATGSDAACYREVQNGDIVFTVVNADASINALVNSNFDHGVENNNRLLGLSCLNGLFEGETSNETVQHKIVVLGIVEQGGAGHLFNIIRQGILTVMNNSPHTLNNGHEAIAYAPSREELPTGGFGTDADEHGVAKLWFMEFDRDKQSVTPKPMYLCLKAIDNKADKGKGYLRSYKKVCTEFEGGVTDTTIVTLASISKAIGFTQLKALVAGSPDISGILTQIQTIVEKNAAFKSTQREMLFAQFSEEPMWIEPVTAVQSPLNRIQARASSRLLRSVSAYDQDLKKNIVGKILTTALPGQPFSLQVNK